MAKKTKTKSTDPFYDPDPLFDDSAEHLNRQAERLRKGGALVGEPGTPQRLKDDGSLADFDDDEDDEEEEVDDASDEEG